MLEMLLLAAAQVQTIYLPPVTPTNPAAPTVQRQTPAVPADINDLPDLVISGIRVAAADGVHFQIENRGSAAATAPVRVTGCAHFNVGEMLEGMGLRDEIYCSPPKGGGALAPGQSMWVRIDCFKSNGRLVATSGSGLFGGSGPPTITTPKCVDVSELQISKYTATADPVPTNSSEGPRPTPVALQQECSYTRGCIDEINEGNNRAEFVAPFPG